MLVCPPAPGPIHSNILPRWGPAEGDYRQFIQRGVHRSVISAEKNRAALAFQQVCPAFIRRSRHSARRRGRGRYRWSARIAGCRTPGLGSPAVPTRAFARRRPGFSNNGRPHTKSAASLSALGGLQAISAPPTSFHRLGTARISNFSVHQAGTPALRRNAGRRDLKCRGLRDNNLVFGPAATPQRYCPRRLIRVSLVSL